MFSGKERNADELIRKHIEVVGAAIQACREALIAYLDGDWKKFKKMAKVTDAKESDADAVRREVEDALHSGAYLSAYREDFSTLVDFIDDMADDAEAIVDFLAVETPGIPARWGEMLKQIIEKTLEGFVAFRKSFNLLYDDMKEAYSTTTQVRDVEREIDTVQNRILRRIFQSDLSLVEKIHLRELILKLGEISNSTENASDKVRGLTFKVRF